MTPKHGENHPLWPSVLGIVAVLCVAVAVLILAIGYPQWKP